LRQGAKIMLGMLLNSAHRANSIVAGLAVGVDLVPNVFLAAGNSRQRDVPTQGLLQRQNMV